MSRTTSGQALQADTEVVQFDPKGYAEALRETWSRAGFAPNPPLDGKAAEAYFDFCVGAALYAGCGRMAMAPPGTSAECVAGREAWLQMNRSQGWCLQEPSTQRPVPGC